MEGFLMYKSFVDLTERQKDVLQVLVEETEKKGYPPTVREIGKIVGLSSSATVYNHLKQLEKKGYIKKDPAKPRAIEIVNKALKINKNLVNVPLVNQVTAGEPLQVFENIADTFPLPFDFLKTKDVFMLHVKGESMINAGIFDGDLVIVQKQNTAEDGEIIVALIDDEATVKKFYKGHNYIRLQPENNSYAPLIIRSNQQLHILGKVIGLLRRF